jgi:hypothetical protein
MRRRASVRSSRNASSPSFRQHHPLQSEQAARATMAGNRVGPGDTGAANRSSRRALLRSKKGVAQVMPEPLNAFRCHGDEALGQTCPTPPSLRARFRATRGIVALLELPHAIRFAFGPGHPSDAALARVCESEPPGVPSMTAANIGLHLGLPKAISLPDPILSFVGVFESATVGEAGQLFGARSRNRSLRPILSFFITQ